ncbi:uncharacterized protein LOC132716551 [Ruditapes philippinarum]|uniref:uncharacterized protein LOC132716551 n=1 Tax=Ruditapes philippinarum TaxID=129788 RepID=UPI00295AEA8A|nr:uncharacterized protein LOC132716551 [Ruditapes philippinarum]
MGLCGSASLWAIIALVVAIIAMILDIVGVATISWMVYQITTNSIRVGLFRMKSCVAKACTEGDVNSGFKDANFTATQGFEILALILLLLAPIALCVYVCVRSMRGTCLAYTAMIMLFTAAFFCFVGMICWLSYVPDPYVVSYSLGLTVIAAILACIAGLLIIPEVLDDGRQVTPNRRF